MVDATPLSELGLREGDYHLPTQIEPQECKNLLVNITDSTPSNELLQMLTPDNLDAVIAKGISVIAQERTDLKDEFFGVELAPAEAFSVIVNASSQPHLINCCVNNIIDNTFFLGYLNVSKKAKTVNDQAREEISNLSRQQIDLNRMLLKLLIVDVKQRIGTMKNDPEFYAGKGELKPFIGEAEKKLADLTKQKSVTDEIKQQVEDVIEGIQKFEAGSNNLYNDVCMPIAEVILGVGEEIYIPKGEELLGTVDLWDSPVMKLPTS